MRQASKPVDREEPIVDTVAGPDKPAASSTVARILVVDDDARNLFAMERILADLGHEVVSARSGEEALRHLLDRDFALILMDVRMPDLDGYDVAELIRARPRCRYVPIIFITAFGRDDQHVFRGYSAGAVDYVFKPVDPLILKSKVSVFVDLFRKSEEIKRQAELERALLEENFRVRAAKLRSEEALRRREEQYALIIRSLPIALYTAGPDDAGSRRRFVSENIEAVSGFPARCFADDQFWRSRIHPDDRERVLADFAALAAQGSVATEYRWLASDGSERYFLDHAVQVRDQRGRGREVFGTWLDITERKRLESELHRSQRLEAIGRLTGGIAHDFNNMLSVVIGNLDLLQLQVEGNPALERFAAQALKGALRCSELTRHLLSFARQQPLAAKIFDLATLVSGMTELLGRTLGNNIKIDYRAAPDLLPVAADPAHAEAALPNIVFNARDAMPEGGTLVIELANAHWDEDDKARPADCAPGDYVMVRVTDSGTGMPPEVAARAFEPFFTTKDVGRGTGLGLSTTYGFLKQSGGHAAIASELGRGTTVSLYFPAAAEARAGEAGDEAQDKAAPSTAVALDGPVLVVEDESDVRAIAVATLTNMGLSVIEAADAQAALDILDRRDDVRLLFTDIMMPGMNGTALAEEAVRRRPTLKVLYATGCDGQAWEGKPASEPLRKPYRAHELAARIRDMLEPG
jgi:PAS domain S-box-containing protein